MRTVWNESNINISMFVEMQDESKSLTVAKSLASVNDIFSIKKETVSNLCRLEVSQVLTKGRLQALSLA